MYNKIDWDTIDLNREPPREEPARQYYYIARCRKKVSELEEEAGRKLSFHVETFGCQMNAHDSEKLTAILREIGYRESEQEVCDLVLYNTCTVRENANLKVYGHLGHLKKEKKKNPYMLIGLCGCMMQESHVVDKLKQSYRFVDFIFGTHNVFQLAEILYHRLEAGGQIIDIWDSTEQIVENLPSERKFSFKTGVNIMYGCNNFCSYCIVPYVRGRERSREPKEILREIEALVKDGVVEVMLLGQNVNSYGKNLEKPVSFAELLTEVEQVEGLKRIRFMTSHPKDLSDELIAVMANSKKICRHFHLPLQCGSSRLLEDMNRRYTKEQYLGLVAKLRRAMPDLSITTDIIVGYPGETEEDFLETIDVVKQVQYDSAYTFIYSRRSGTPAASREQVPEEVVKERFNRLLAVVNEISKQRTARLTGTIQEVLVESIDDHDDTMVTGRLENATQVHFKGGREDIGQFRQVYLKEAKGFYYLGEVVS